jgi:hypothetical protein
VARQRGRDGRPIPDVDMSSEFEEVRRRAYHERVRLERAHPAHSFDEEIDRLGSKPGWRVTKRREER